MEYVKRSGEAAGPYGVVVMRSWRRAQDRLRGSLAGAGKQGGEAGRDAVQGGVDAADADN